MKRILLAVPCCLLLASCPNTLAAAEEYDAYYRFALQDGVITDGEAAELKRLRDELLAARDETPQWELILTGVLSAAGAVLYRTFNLPGSQRVGNRNGQ